MTSWLDNLVKQHEELESPLSFWRWSAISAISASVKDNVWLNRQIYNLYPNIYVMLHAESGLKKGPPISMGKQLVRAVNNTKIISGRSSIQGILKELGTAQTVQGNKGIVTGGATAFICSSELSSSIVDDPVATTILTDLYDRQYNIDEWKSLLKMESFNLNSPTITMLTATNEAMGESFFVKKDIHGGFFARTFVIYEDKRNKINSLAYPLTSTPDYKSAAEYLKELSKLKGSFQDLGKLEQDNIFRYSKIKENRTIYFSEIGLFYDNWYDEFCKQVDVQEVKDETGTLNRFGDSVLKVAMLLSLARNPILTIDMESMQEAINISEKLVGNIRRTTMGKKGLSASSTLKGMVINELLFRDTHQVTRKVLMKKMWMHYTDSSEFDEMMLSLDASGIIKLSSMGDNIIYTMPSNQVDEMKRFLSGKNK